MIGPYRLGEDVERTPGYFVARAVDERTLREVVIKVLTANVARDRFRKEAAALMAVEHPSVVMLYDYSDEDAAQPYIVYEALTGQTLAGLVKTRGALPVIM